ncbi:MAG: heavy metal-binding domain-containing protein [Scytonema hyalinum WJT4-NPBG1]|jgi:uncharacterized protein YbjQ (UPF0145 family)|nr:heavy metal-binding domain-containing protein [Scytonema hyalinum WJT4-NPBG1]
MFDDSNQLDASTTTPHNIPTHGFERLQSMRGEGGHPRLFTSDLSVNEFLLIKEAGFEPLGLVVGCSIYHTGYQVAGWNQSQEMTVLSQAMYHARELAMSRMEEEADALGADGIVAVRLTAKHTEWGRHLIEFVAIGTAVYATDRQASYRTIHGKPFTSDLSGQDFWTLLKAGYRPVGMVMGSCVYHIAYQGLRQRLQNLTKNIEMADFTQALYDARELAIERMQQEAMHLQAEGIVGVQISEGSYSWDSHIIEFFVVGTAVVPMRSDHHIPPPQLVLSLNE